MKTSSSNLVVVFIFILIPYALFFYELIPGLSGSFLLILPVVAAGFLFYKNQSMPNPSTLLRIFSVVVFVFGIFLHGSNHRVHSIFDLADLRMYFLDKIMFEF